MTILLTVLMFMVAGCTTVRHVDLIPDVPVLSCAWDNGQRNTIYSRDIAKVEKRDGRVRVWIQGRDGVPSVMEEGHPDYACSSWAFAFEVGQWPIYLVVY